MYLNGLLTRKLCILVVVIKLIYCCESLKTVSMVTEMCELLLAIAF